MNAARKLDIRDLEVKKPHTWQAHHGGRCPVLPDMLVKIRYRNGDEVGPVPAKSRRWEAWRPYQLPASRTGETSYDIIAFLIVETAE